MPTPLQHTSLVVCVLYLLHLDDLSLLQHLNGVETRVVLGLHKVYTPKGASAESTLKVEVRERIFALRFSRWIRCRTFGRLAELRYRAIGGITAVCAVVLGVGLID